MNNSEIDDLSNRILRTIRGKKKEDLSAGRLAQKLKCKKADIEAAVELLRQTGYDIDFDQKGFIRFVSAPDLLLPAEISCGLKTGFMGHSIYAYKSVQSTNAIAAKLAHDKTPEGTIVVSESQTRGRGRLGRAWHSPEGRGIYLSIVLYPRIDPAIISGLSLVTAVSLAETLETYKPRRVQIKWPNDCLVNGRKVAGILTELSAELGLTHYAVVGIGINVNHRKTDFPTDLASRATSLGIELKRDIARVELLQKFLKRFEKDYLRFMKSNLRGLHKKIIGYSNLIGRRIKLDMSGRIISGKAVDIDRTGNLVVETRQGRQAFNAGEVTLVRKS